MSSNSTIAWGDTEQSVGNNWGWLQLVFPRSSVCRTARQLY